MKIDTALEVSIPDTEEELRLFDQKYAYQGNDLGVTVRRGAVKFKLWAPTAQKVTLRLYEAGDGDCLLTEKEMTRGQQGTWYFRGDDRLRGLYYTYAVTVKGKTREAVDPYARTCGVNGKRGMVFDPAEANPQGWMRTPRPKAPEGGPVLYEVHVRDFSIDPSGGFEHPGKFLALTERGRKNKAGQAAGLDHLLELGVTHIQLQPVFDFCSVDEDRPDVPQYNWGYDPMNYNVPEGSYATDARDGAVRVREMKEMILALHKAGIRVVMDVVYNHTGSLEDSSFTKTVPGYYYRKNKDGAFSNGSGCGNETATERAMVRKYIVDSACYWAREYKIDGFRFDLMGLHGLDCMREVRDALRKIDPSILVYGEGWTGGDSPLPEAERAVKANASLLPGVGFFSDDLRDGVRGFVFQQEDRGFVSGGEDTDCGETVKMGSMGCVRHHQVNYSKAKYAKTPWAKNSRQAINYVECHDNLTLWNKLALSRPDATHAERVAMDKMAAAVVFTSLGTPFLQMGQEFLRTKPDGKGGFVDNSYCSGDEVNAIRWDRKTQYREVYEYYRGLIAFRKAHPALRLSTQQEVKTCVHFFKREVPGVVAYQIVTDSEKLVVIHNSAPFAKMLPIPSGTWKVYVNENHAGTEPLETFSGGRALIQPTSTLVMAKANHAKLRRTLLAVGAAAVTVAAVTTFTENETVRKKIRGTKAGGRIPESVWNFRIPSLKKLAGGRYAKKRK